MLNLFITSKCNLNCDYCFVASDFNLAPTLLSKPDFLSLLSWLKETNAASLAILGGEPTLHPELLFFLDSLWSSGVCPVLFTNALFPSSLAEPLAKLTYNIVVNYNQPKMYSREAYALREKNISLLVEFGGRLAFSKNFAPGFLDYDYLIDGAKRFGIKTIRYDLSRPREDRKNIYFDQKSSQKSIQNSSQQNNQTNPHNSPPNSSQQNPLTSTDLATIALVDFVRMATKADLTVGLDCCLPPCLFSQEDLGDLRRLSDPFSGTCRPSLDILTDLSVRHCWPLKNISAPKVSSFDGELDLLGFFAELALPIRQKNRNQCGPCQFPPSECQGGCLASS
ncbi:MAG: radical SAM protein [Deltaproteobacteria bacterium]|jgi:organic radical activating enzyme|nr:radical SAM protein [Deltaproteobacteria bacterium]